VVVVVAVVPVVDVSVFSSASQAPALTTVILLPDLQFSFSKTHLLPYVFPSEPHTGENSFVHAFGQPCSSGVLPKAMISSKVSGAE